MGSSAPSSLRRRGVCDAGFGATVRGRNRTGQIGELISPTITMLLASVDGHLSRKRGANPGWRRITPPPLFNYGNRRHRESVSVTVEDALRKIALLRKTLSAPTRDSEPSQTTALRLLVGIGRFKQK